MTMIGSQRRSRRRVRRSVDELDNESRARLRNFISGARLVVIPTSEALGLVESRLAPGTVPLAVACVAGLGIDQTIAVAEVLAAKGYDVTPHLAARQITTPRHLDDILLRLRRRAVDRVLVVEGRDGSSSAFRHSARLLAVMSDHPNAPSSVGIAGHPEGHPGHDTAELTGSLLERAGFASFVSTRLSLNPVRLLGWLAEMRVRGLSIPVEAGVPGCVNLKDLGAEDPSLVQQDRGQAAGWYDPTPLVVELARQPVVERLGLTGLRVDTFNHIHATAAWRQGLYDLSQQTRSA